MTIEGGNLMAYFLNASIKHNSFTEVANYKYFVDKSGLIEKINKNIKTPGKYICITKPRRFGKTINAMMLASYYSKNADFKNLFDKLEISEDPSYSAHLNKHNVIYMTFNSNASDLKTYSDYIEFYKTRLARDITEAYPFVNADDTLSEMLNQASDKTGEGFVFVIDEWDYIFNNNLFSEEYRIKFLTFIEDLLKDKSYVDLAYMTGILPIAKYFSGSTANMFDEYTFINDDTYDKYFGFTNDEVSKLCSKQNKISINDLKEWYNGYKTLGGYEVYNPRSVMYALKRTPRLMWR